MTVPPALAPVGRARSSAGVNSAGAVRAAASRSDITLPAIANVSFFYRLNTAVGHDGGRAVHRLVDDQGPDVRAHDGAGRRCRRRRENFDDAWRVRSARTTGSTTSGSSAAASRATRRRSTTTDRTPRLPDADRWWLAVGAQYKWTPNSKFDAGFDLHLRRTARRQPERRAARRSNGLIKGTLRRERVRSSRCRDLHVLASRTSRPRRRPQTPVRAARRCAAAVSRAGRILLVTVNPPFLVRQGRRARRRRHGRADRRALRQRRHPGAAVRPAGEGRRSRRPRRRRRSRTSPSSSRRRSRPRIAPRAIEACHYGADLARLRECDLVIEAIAERLDWKRDLYAKVAPHLAPHAVLASNTSGLSLAALSRRAAGRRCARASAACTSSIRRATCTWSS